MWYEGDVKFITNAYMFIMCKKDPLLDKIMLELKYRSKGN